MSEGAGSGRPRRFPIDLGRLQPSAPESGGRSQPQTLLRPQAPLRQAASDRQRQNVPQGVGLDSLHVRRRMVERLMAQGLRHPGVIAALNAVPRHSFVDTALANQAYEDTSLPIGLGQTISKPSVVAAMIELLCLRPGLSAVEGEDVRVPTRPLGRCLEIGTGCGYQAAVLMQLARQVVSIERVKELHTKARGHLDAMRQHMGANHLACDARLVYGDGMIGHAPLAPYDTIIAAAGGSALPQSWLEQLAPGGRLVAPSSAEGAAGRQTLCIVDRLADGQLRYANGGEVLFVPLKSGTV